MVCISVAMDSFLCKELKAIVMKLVDVQKLFVFFLTTNHLNQTFLL